MNRYRRGIAFFSSLAIHAALGAWLVFSYQTELGQTGRVFVEISGIETIAREQTGNSSNKDPDKTPPLSNTPQAAQDHPSLSQASTLTSAPPVIAGGNTGKPSTQSAGPSSQVLGSYLSQIREKISRAIQPPHGHLLSSLKTTLRLTLTETGEVKNQEIEQSSGSPDFDRAILAALEKSRPFPPFTHEMAEIHEVTLKLPIEIRPY